jgi:rubrerythrin
MAVVAAGAELERSAIHFYKDAATRCPDEESAKVFRFLAEWEAGHLETLVDLERQMRDSWFAEQGFSPF